MMSISGSPPIKGNLAEGQGFEPWVGGYPTTVFKTVSLGHSDSPPAVFLFARGIRTPLNQTALHRGRAYRAICGVDGLAALHRFSVAIGTPD
jgi:hypothetical protein